MSDNIADLFKMFIKEYGKEHPGGYLYRCRKCKCSTYTREAWFPCKDKFLPEKIVCPLCGGRWKLVIKPDDICDTVCR